MASPSNTLASAPSSVREVVGNRSSIDRAQGVRRRGSHGGSSRYHGSAGLGCCGAPYRWRRRPAESSDMLDSVSRSGKALGVAGHEVNIAAQADCPLVNECAESESACMVCPLCFGARPCCEIPARIPALCLLQVNYLQRHGGRCDHFTHCSKCK